MNTTEMTQNDMSAETNTNPETSVANATGEAPVTAVVETVLENVAAEVAPQAEAVVAAPAPETIEVPSQEVNLLEVDNILDLEEIQYPQFTLAKNKARFLRMLSWYRTKREWLDVAPMSGLTKLFKSQTKELEGIRANKLDYEMELETGTLTPSQRSYKKDELKMCRVQEKMAVQLITKMQIKIKSGRR